MTAEATLPHPGRAETDAEESSALEFRDPPPAPMGPSTWNSLYYAWMVITLLVGLGTILNGGSWYSAIVRMFITLLGGSFLTIAFLTFVIIPLHVKRYEQLVEARKAAQAAARQKAAEQQAAAEDESYDQLPAMTNEPSFASERPLPGTPPTPRHEDQAASLRRMAATGK